MNGLSLGLRRLPIAIGYALAVILVAPLLAPDPTGVSVVVAVAAGLALVAHGALTGRLRAVGWAVAAAVAARLVWTLAAGLARAGAVAVPGVVAAANLPVVAVAAAAAYRWRGW